MLRVQPDKPLSEELVKQIINETIMIPDVLRHLRNFAKKNGYTVILKKMLELAEETKVALGRNKPTR